MAFVNINQHKIVLKTISSIISGNNIKENEEKLNSFRKQAQYHLIICNVLAQLSRNSNLKMSQLQLNRKTFLILQIKKSTHKLQNQQCWWLLRDVYYSDSDKVAKIVRQICLFYQGIDKQNNTKFLQILFTVNFQSLGLVGIVRFLLLVHSLLKDQIQSLQNSTIKRCGQVIVNNLFSLLCLDLDSQFVYQFALSNLMLIHGFIVENNCWKNVNEWNQILTNIVQSKNNSLIKFLGTLLKQIIDKGSQGTHILSQNSTETRQRNHLYNKKQVVSSIAYCLEKIHNVFFDKNPEKYFYVDSLDLINSYRAESFNLCHSTQQQNYLYVSEISYLFFQYIEQQLSSNIKYGIFQLQSDENEDLICKQKKYSIIRTIFQNNSKQILQKIIKTEVPFYLKIMQLAVFMPFLLNCNKLLRCEDFEICLDQLQAALEQQQDAYLFARDKQQYIWTILKFIVKFRKTFSAQLILKICYLLDLLAFKCDTISSECYHILQMLSDQILTFQSQKVTQFYQKSLNHINRCEWVQSHNCYSHILKLIQKINPESISGNNSKGNQNSNSLIQQHSSLQHQILIMIKNIVTLLQNQFNYELMHKINSLLKFLIQNKSRIHLQLRYDELLWITNKNYNFEIFTKESAEVYFYFCHFSENRHLFVQSLDSYDFWETCQSQKLQYYVDIYLKFINSNQQFYSSSEQQQKLCLLKKNLWHKLTSENDPEQRQKIKNVFQRHPKYFSGLSYQQKRMQRRDKIKSMYSIDHCNQTHNNSRSVMQIE